MKNISSITVVIFVLLLVFSSAAFAQKQTAALEIIDYPDQISAQQTITADYKKSGKIDFVDINDNPQTIIRITGYRNIGNPVQRVDIDHLNGDRKAQQKIELINVALRKSVDLCNYLTRNRDTDSCWRGNWILYHRMAEKERVNIQPEWYDELNVVVSVKIEWLNPKTRVVRDQSIGTVRIVLERHYFHEYLGEGNYTENSSYVVVGDDSLASLGIKRGTVVKDRQLQWLLDLAYREAQKPENQTIGR